MNIRILDDYHTCTPSRGVVDSISKQKPTRSAGAPVRQSRRYSLISWVGDTPGSPTKILAPLQLTRIPAPLLLTRIPAPLYPTPSHSARITAASNRTQILAPLHPTWIWAQCICFTLYLYIYIDARSLTRWLLEVNFWLELVQIMTRSIIIYVYEMLWKCFLYYT